MHREKWILFTVERNFCPVLLIAFCGDQNGLLTLLLSHPQPLKQEGEFSFHAPHYRKRLNFRGPDYFRRPAHENTMLFSSARVTDENVSYFRGPAKIFVGRPTKIRKVFSSASGTDETVCYFRRPQLGRRKYVAYFRRPHPGRRK